MKATKKQTRGKDEKSCIIQNLFMLKKNFMARNQIKVLVPSSKYTSDQNYILLKSNQYQEPHPSLNIKTSTYTAFLSLSFVF